MTHREFEELLPWYANKTLSDSERRAVAEHLRTCAECRAELEGLNDVVDAETTASRQAPRLPPDLLDSALEQIDKIHTPEDKPGLGRRVLDWVRRRRSR